MNFNQSLASYKRDIDQALVKFFDTKIRDARKFSKDSENLVKVLADYTTRQGAKRIRGSLVRVGYELFGGKKASAIGPVCVAMELIQSYILIHDDIIDRDEVRRGGPTAHVAFTNKYKKKFGFEAAHFGNSFALIAGDLSDTYALDLISGANFPDNKKITALNTLYRNIGKTIHGQVLDLVGSSNRTEVIKMMETKTSRYTFVNPLAIGAILAGASKSSLKTIEAYGLPLGIAFQMRNDAVELFGSSKVIGKNLGTDIKEKRMTLLMVEAFKRASQSQKARLNKIWSKSSITTRDIETVKSIIVQSGSFEYNQELSVKLVKQAKKSLTKLSRVNQEAKQFLLDLAEYVITRSR